MFYKYDRVDYMKLLVIHLHILNRWYYQSSRYLNCSIYAAPLLLIINISGKIVAAPNRLTNAAWNILLAPSNSCLYHSLCCLC